MNVILNMSISRILNSKHLINPKTVLIGIVLLLTVTQSLYAQVVINFPDANLEQVIRDEIGKPAGDIFDIDLEPMIYLNAGWKNIADLTGLEYCTSLTVLDLGYNQISDINPLQNLTSLTNLYLSSNFQIIDLSIPENQSTALSILV